MSNSIPQVSVIIPTYNRPMLLKLAIKSVLKQTFQDFEILVIDDGLENRADKIISQFSDNRIIYVQNKKNSGASASRNIGINRARGEFITFLDDDDEFYPKKIEKQYEIMKKFDKQIDFTFCLADIYSQKNGKLIYTHKYNFQEGLKTFFEEALSLKLSMITPTVFCKREKALEIGNFDESLSCAEDKDFFIRLSKNSCGFFMKKVLVRVNSCVQKESHLSGNMKFRISGRELLLNKHITDLIIRPKILEKHIFILALLNQEDKNFKKSNKLLFRGWKLNKKDIRFPKQILKNLYLSLLESTFNKKSN
ncbi:glycosyltransferase [Patescibacteria group bacterium]|nr:glycosyltransferase [Patescibacteria group bacterium]